MLISNYNWRDARFLFETPADNGNPEPPSSETDEEPFDKERAMATITKLREFERNAKRLQAELDTIKKAEEERKEKELTAVQIAEKRAQEAQAARDALEQRYRTNTIKSAIRLAAMTAGFIDPEDAIQLADLSTVDVGDDDKVTGATEAVKALAQAKPHLVKPTKPQAPDINATGGGNPPPITPEVIVQQKQQSGQYVPF